MRIGIDISQAVYEGTGVGRYVTELTKAMITEQTGTDFILFGSSYGRYEQLLAIAQELKAISPGHVSYKLFVFPLSFFDVLWNKLHIIPVEWFIGRIDVFWSSDWIQPPLATAIGMTTIHDVSFFRFPESFNKHIIDVHTRRLGRVAVECERILCDSEATKRDVVEFLRIPESRLDVVYPGFSLLHKEVGISV
jgi:hypothetical protein